ncbi:hypothetical protein [Marimonas lutisalis]|uniref:hypothetical protein n=1 Tax=Marimonas lutisalis TaxID=2545756 RepID=UPI0010F51361|nr:hypothetical protein [Marimonas lutisalis]
MKSTAETADGFGQTLALPRAALLHRGEAALVALTLLVAVLAIGTAAATGQRVDWAGFGLSYLPAIGLLALGLYARHVKGLERLAMLAVGLAVYFGFSGVIAVMIYLRFPIETALLDEAIIALDARLGYDWVAFTETIGQYPALSRGLAWV